MISRGEGRIAELGLHALGDDERPEGVDQRLGRSVPHAVGAPQDAFRPDRGQQLAEDVSGFLGLAHHHEPRASELGVHVGARRDPRIAQAGHQAVHAPVPGGLLPWALLASGDVGLVARVIDEERHVREELGRGPDVARRRGQRTGARYQAVDSLVDGDDTGSDGLDPVEEGQPHLLVVEVPAGVALIDGRIVRLPHRVDLPTRRMEFIAPMIEKVDLAGNVGVHDRVVQDPAGPGVAVDDLADRGDLLVGDDVLIGASRS